MPRKKIPDQLTLIEDDGIRLWISIRARRHKDAAGLLALWLAAWTAAGVAGVRDWVRSPNAEWWLLALGGAIIAANLACTVMALLYCLYGRDVLIARPGRITVREEVFGWGVGRTYPAADIKIVEFESRDVQRSHGLTDAQLDDNSLWLVKGRGLKLVGAGLTLEHAERLRRRIMVRVLTGVTP